MKPRWSCAFRIAALAIVIAGGTGCTRRNDACGDASTTSAELAPPAWTRTPYPAPAPPPLGAASAASPDRAPAVTAASAANTPPAAPPPVAEPPAPEWVPDAGRLTVVSAGDLARNLGITAPPSTAPATITTPPATADGGAAPSP